MCLIKLHRFPKISFKPIEVYKVFLCNDGDYTNNYRACLTKELIREVGFYTPFAGYGPVSIKSGTIVESKCSLLKGFYNIFFGKSIGKEGVHAYTCEDSAKKFWFDGFTIVKCVIPKFTLYWYGKDNEIAARKIQIL